MKRLVVCFDGTWNDSDNRGAPTNVVRFANMVPPHDGNGNPQLVLYDQGVGNGNVVDKFAGGAFGNGLEAHVKLGFLFLSQNYEPGDEIYLFGFSRGAFTARSLGGFIGACRGLLQRDKLHKLEAAWDNYRTPPAERNTFTLRNEILDNTIAGVRIKVLGVWDTVGSLGIPTDAFNSYNRHKYAFHDTTLSSIVDHAFQALAIDEMRGPFAATLWERRPKPIAGQIVEQVWFAGVHSDIGGGYRNSELSDLSLRWMIGRTISNSSLTFETQKLNYFLPDAIADGDFPGGQTAKSLAVDRILEKSLGPAHDSLGAYVASRLSPRMRVIGGILPESGSGPIAGFYRLSGAASARSFCEAIHWSVSERLHNLRDPVRGRYTPPNLKVAIDTLPVISMAGERTVGVPWQPP